MDTVEEEGCVEESPPISSALPKKGCNCPQITISNLDRTDETTANSSRSASMSSRRPSMILAALRRPSQNLALSVAHAIMHQKKHSPPMAQIQNEKNGNDDCSDDKKIIEDNCTKLGDDALTTILSALYAKLLVVLGIAFPITEIISEVSPFFYLGFYLYLYIGSIAFVGYMYTSMYKTNGGIYSMFNSHDDDKQQNRERRSLYHNSQPQHSHGHRIVRYGSFYLRLGAIGFGIGSMVYSGLEFGRYFELRGDANCNSSILQAISPATRMILTIVQIQFIFLNGKDLMASGHRIVTKFGLMHMIAANLCEWLYVLVEETEHEIIHLEGHHNISNNTENSTHIAGYCKEGTVMGPLLASASPFLFPCTIEYSLICAVILFEMWKTVKTIKEEEPTPEAPKKTHSLTPHEKISQLFNFPHTMIESHKKSAHHFTLDCSSSHKGLFAGILVIVTTIISLTIFLVLKDKKGASAEEEAYFKAGAQLEVNIVEILIHVVSIGAVLAAMWQFRALKYDRQSQDKQSGFGLDNTLLVVAQTGMFIYCMFSIIGFTMSYKSPAGLLAEIFSFTQTCLQTIFVLDAWWRRCRTAEETRRKPGRELITFLIIANMAMWSINSLEKNRAEFRTNQLRFYGEWAWTIITHISMPMAIFYRFHSTICLFEIWKSAYKVKAQPKNTILNLL